MFNVVRTGGRAQSLVRVVVGLVGLTLVSCQSTRRGHTRADFPAVLEETYTIGAPDELTIAIFPQNELDQVVQVRPDGQITMNLIGDVFVEGLTPEEVDAVLSQRLREYLKGAEVTVTVSGFGSKHIYIVGEVAGPGRYSYTGKTSVLDAVMTAGSFTRRADIGRFILVRPSETNPQVIDVDFAEVVRNGRAEYDLYLQPGDLLFVPPNGLARVGYNLEALLFPFQPLIGPAGFALGIYAVAND